MRLIRFLTIASFSLGCYAQEAETADPKPGEGTLGDRLWLSGQMNDVAQYHPSFPALYSGPNSLDSNAEVKPTWVITLYTGYGFTKNTEVFLDVESAHGSGVSGALGLGSLGNLDAVTDPSASAAPYVARALLRHIIRLGDENTEAPRSPLGLTTSVPVKRLELIVGKMSLTDYFDLNAVGSDSHLQFLQYAIDNNAAYDIAADSRGYTYGALAELHQPAWTARFALAFQPTDATGHSINWHLGQAHSENLEFEIHPTFVKNRPAVLRALAFLNKASMSSYREAVDAYLSGRDPKPDLSLHIKAGRIDYGFGINGEQELNDYLRIFGRAGWNQGTKEAYAFAEANSTFSLGGDINGKKWKRPGHQIGLAFATDGLAADHRRYLELGGTSYLLGDGGLRYGRETVLEAYYNLPLMHGVFTSIDVQRIWNPGYNRDRGPVIVFGFRLHLEGDLHFN
jgi:high affinity Mn2+ porin